MITSLRFFFHQKETESISAYHHLPLLYNMLRHLFQCQSEIDTEYIYDNTQHRRNHIYYILLIFPSPYQKAIPCSHSHQCYYISTPQQPLAGQTEQRLNARSYERSPASALWSAFTHTSRPAERRRRQGGATPLSSRSRAWKVEGRERERERSAARREAHEKPTNAASGGRRG